MANQACCATCGAGGGEPVSAPLRKLSQMFKPACSPARADFVFRPRPQGARGALRIFPKNG